jgi:nitrite reductase/ring-hydroxylating ferredoxin subunit
MVGTDRYGTAAPTGINAHQTTIAVADATHIAVGDYLSVGDEMMYVKSVDGNYIGALVSCPHALCTIRSRSSARSREKPFTPASRKGRWN